jgi:hypothetical protein
MSEGGTPATRAPARQLLPVVLTATVVGGVILAYYVLIVSAGLSPPWPRWSAFYDAQAEGFRAGHLYALPPGPPGARIWDYTLYNGHHYLYWGLLPALLLAIIKGLFRLTVTVGDEVLVLVTLVIRALAAGLLLRRLAMRLEPRPPRALVWVAFIVLALANPTPYLLARAAVYEAAIAAGSVFLFVGLTAAVEGLFADDERRSARWLAAAGAAFAGAAASRVSLWPMAAATTVFLAIIEARRRRLSLLRFVGLSVRVGAPALAILAVCLALNKARFGQWLEFGTTYQVGFVFVMGWRFVPVNTFLNLFQPPQLSCRFPFVLAPWDASRSITPSWVPWPDGFRATEPVTGILLGVPFVALALLTAVAWGRARRAPGGVLASPWRIVGLCGLGAVSSAIPIFAVYSVSMRYETDFLSFLLPLAAMGGWWLVGLSPRPARRRAAIAVFVTLAFVSVAIGAALGFTGYFNHFDRHNPTLIKTLRKKVGVCHGP